MMKTKTYSQWTTKCQIPSWQNDVYSHIYNPYHPSIIISFFLFQEQFRVILQFYLYCGLSLCLQQRNNSKDMFNYMGCTQDMVQKGVKDFGLAVGARKMIDNQYTHAVTSLESGIYITLWNQQKKSECFRLGQYSKCFCGHQFSFHNNKFFGKKFNTACKDCACKTFRYVPSRPQECGMYWLVRRKDFDVKSWRAPCKCKHTCEEHNPTYPAKCKKCSCFDFMGNFACLTCDGAWQDHQVLYQTDQQRKMMGKTVGQAYLPLAQHSHIQKEVFNKQKYAMIKGRSVPSGKQIKQVQKKHVQLNPVRPSKAQQSKLKSPFGFVFKPKYPQFLKK